MTCLGISSWDLQCFYRIAVAGYFTQTHKFALVAVPGISLTSTYLLNCALISPDKRNRKSLRSITGQGVKRPRAFGPCSPFG
jgi:hypothetical protein